MFFFIPFCFGCFENCSKVFWSSSALIDSFEQFLQVSHSFLEGQTFPKLVSLNSHIPLVLDLHLIHSQSASISLEFPKVLLLLEDSHHPFRCWKSWFAIFQVFVKLGNQFQSLKVWQIFHQIVSLIQHPEKIVHVHTPIWLIYFFFFFWVIRGKLLKFRSYSFGSIDIPSISSSISLG